MWRRGGIHTGTFIIGFNHYRYLFQITEQYLSSAETESVFGPPGQVFLYEWSKFRYGVFEEHGYPGDPLYPMFYSKQIFTANGASNVVKPNFCTNVEPSGSETYIIVVYIYHNYRRYREH